MRVVMVASAVVVAGASGGGRPSAVAFVRCAVAVVFCACRDGPAGLPGGFTGALHFAMRSGPWR